MATWDDVRRIAMGLPETEERDGPQWRIRGKLFAWDRPLRKAADFARFAGQKVDVRMRLADAHGRRRYIGRLMGIEGATATVEVDGAPVALPLDGMDRARLVPEL